MMHPLFVLLRDIKDKTSHSVAYLRDNRVDATLSVRGIAVRRVFAPLLRLLYRTQSKYCLRVDARVPLHRTRVGKIFALNHRQADDIVLGANAVGCSGYVVFGNAYLALETPSGLGLWAYGMILLDRADKESRKATYEKMRFIIEHGGNVIIYPEGYWNLDDNGQRDERHGADGHNSESWLVQDVNIGLLRLAQETGCEIVPTVLHYDEHEKQRCYAVRGAPLCVRQDDDILQKKDELVEVMQTLYYGLMERHSAYRRADLESDGVPMRRQWARLKETLRRACDIDAIGYRLNLQDEKRIGKAKVSKLVVTREEAFMHLQAIAPRSGNAFLWSGHG